MLAKLERMTGHSDGGSVAKLTTIWNDLVSSVNRPWNFLANLASILGLVITVLVLLKWNATIVPVVYICLLSFFLVIRYMRQERWARYAQSAELLQEAYRLTQRAAECSIYGQENFDQYIERLTSSLDSFAQAFTLITGAPCRSCIAEVRVDMGHAREGEPISAADVFVISVLLRSGKKQSSSSDITQPVAGNTDFLKVLQTGEPFFHNNLPAVFKARKYHNSKWDDSLLETTEYPYRATIVWPISMSDTQLPSDGEIQPPLAFLCIDTKRRGAFRRASDVPLGACYAHAIYPVVRHLIGPLTPVREK